MQTSSYLFLICFTVFFAVNFPNTKAGSIENFVNDESNDDSEELWQKDQWMEMPLDHFNLFDNRTWKMRYFINNEFFQEGMPLFIEIGGEWTVSGSTLLEGQIYSLAKKHHGYLLATEHRYYGNSLPFGKNVSSENMRYLQIEQALEDLVYLIHHLKESTPGLENSKVVVHGCSYAGMLATWVRSRFPNTVDIAYASSAPLGVEMDYPEYYEVLNDVYANISVSCIDTIKKGFSEMVELLETNEGHETVINALKNWNCDKVDDMHSGDIIWTMISILNVQYDPVQYEEVGCLVMAMDTDDLTPFERLAKFVVLKSKDRQACSASDTVDEDEGEVEVDQDGISWTYQTCTEVGFFQTLNQKNPQNPFPVDITIEESVEMCTASFGDGVSEKLIKTGVERVNRRYGGKHPQVTKLLTVHGTADPWRALGIPEEINPEAPVIILRGSHCVDDSAREDDPPEIVKARETMRNIISKWLEQI